ncbi:hypothetical protein V3C99_015221, partial [Haemonchus contortus]
RFSTDAGHEFEVVNSSVGYRMKNKLLYFALNQTKGQAEALFNCLRYRMFRLQGILFTNRWCSSWYKRIALGEISSEDMQRTGRQLE